MNVLLRDAERSVSEQKKVQIKSLAPYYEKYFLQLWDVDISRMGHYSNSDFKNDNYVETEGGKNYVWLLLTVNLFFNCISLIFLHHMFKYNTTRFTPRRPPLLLYSAQWLNYWCKIHSIWSSRYFGRWISFLIGCHPIAPNNRLIWGHITHLFELWRHL